MQKDNRILNRIIELKRHPEDDWQDDLERLNIKEDLAYFYGMMPDRQIANCILTFIVFAYSADSDYIEPTTDRLENKRNIMKRVAGDGWENKENLLEAVVGDEGGVIDNTIEWYLNRQKDWRWNTIISGWEFHAKAQSLQSTASDVKSMNEAASMLNIADARREKSDNLWDQIKREFMDIDSALAAEKKDKLTDRLKKDDSTWELWVKMKKIRKARIEAMEKAEKEEAD